MSNPHASAGLEARSARLRRVASPLGRMARAELLLFLFCFILKAEILDKPGVIIYTLKRKQ